MSRPSVSLRIFLMTVLFALGVSACAPADVVPSSTPVPTASAPQVVTHTFPPLATPGISLRFAHYSLEEGLSQSSVRSIVQDGLGFLWIGTQDGLNRFDGYSFRVFRAIPGDPGSILGSEINALAAETDGSVWIGTNTALNLYDPASGIFRHWLHRSDDPSSLTDGPIQALLLDSSDRLWIGTRQGLNIYDRNADSFQRISFSELLLDSLSPPSVTALYQDPSGAVWIGTNMGILRRDPVAGNYRLYRHQEYLGETLSFDEVTSMGMDPGGRLWVGTGHGLNRLDAATQRFTRFFHSDSDNASLVDDMVQDIYIDRAGQVWIGTRSGLDRYDPDVQTFIHYRNDPADAQSLANDSVDAIYEDRGGVLWVGTNGGGLNKHDRALDQFAYYKHVNSDPESLGSDFIFPILPAPDGRVWIGTSGGGLSLLDPDTGRAQTFRHSPADSGSLMSDNVRALFLDNRGTLWVGTDRGLDRLDRGSIHFIHYLPDESSSSGLPFGSVYAIYQDRSSNYWIGTARGVRRYDPRTSVFARLEAGGAMAGLSDGPARAILQDRDGALWIGTDSHGLFRLDPDARGIAHFTNQPGNDRSLSSNAIMSIYQDRQGRIWIATFGGGLDRYLPETQEFEVFTQARGLPNDVVYGIVEDNQGYLWLSTNLGLARFDPTSETFRGYTVRDGLQSNEFNSSAFARDGRGRLYFGGVRGLTVFDPAQLTVDPYVPPVVITSIQVDDRTPISAGAEPEVLEQLSLRYPSNSFQVEFSALSYARERGNQYAYILEGFDKDWHTVGSDHEVSYTNLPGGRYVFRVRAANADGVWNEAGRAITITVIPPFWQTWPFSTAVFLLIAGLIVLTYRWRMRDARTKRLELERIIRDRTQELKRQNRDLEALYAADARMLRVLTQDDVLRALVDVAVDVLQANESAVLIPDEVNAAFKVRVVRGFRYAHQQPDEFAGLQQQLLTSVANGEARIFGDLSRDPTWLQQPAALVDLMMREGIRSLMYLPIRVQSVVVGVLEVAASWPDAFNEDRQRLFTALVQRAALSIENSRLFDQTRQMAMLEERTRLAQELHDSAKQKAFAALAQLGAARKLVDHDLDLAGTRLKEAEDIVSEVIHDLAYFIEGSYPRDLEEKGFAGSLRDYAYAWQTRSAIPLKLAIHDERRLSLPVEQLLYRIVQEGMSNIARHSGATQASIGITFGERELQIEIQDNGRGIGPGGSNGGLGLKLMHERIQSLGGRVEIESGQGSGTLIRIRTPINGTH